MEGADRRRSGGGGVNLEQKTDTGKTCEEEEVKEDDSTGDKKKREVDKDRGEGCYSNQAKREAMESFFTTR